MSSDVVYVSIVPDFSAFKQAFENVAAKFKEMAKAFKAFSWAFEEPVRVPEVWESYARSLLDAPRPGVGTRAHSTASREIAEDVVRYLHAVAAIREKEPA